MLLFLSFAACAFAADDPYASLRLYDGTWESRGADPQKVDRLTDRCADVGNYFVCQQTVNGKTAALLVFVPAGDAGHFYVQNILPYGHASGRGELRIDGDRWTFSSSREESGKKTFYRTVNVFTGTDRIHSDSAVSTDGEHWTVTRTGELIRVSAQQQTPVKRR